MGNFFGWIWAIYTELLKLVGNLVFILVGIALCALATYLQFQPDHSSPQDTAIFAVGIILMFSSWARRIIGTIVGLAIPWLLLLVGAFYLFVEDRAHFVFSLPVVLVAIVPPILGAFLLELLPKPPAVENRTSVLPSSDQ